MPHYLDRLFVEDEPVWLDGGQLERLRTRAAQWHRDYCHRELFPGSVVGPQGWIQQFREYPIFAFLS